MVSSWHAGVNPYTLIRSIFIHNCLDSEATKKSIIVGKQINEMIHPEDGISCSSKKVMYLAMQIKEAHWKRADVKQFCFDSVSVAATKCLRLGAS